MGAQYGHACLTPPWSLGATAPTQGPGTVEASGQLPLECQVISADTALTGWGSVLLEESWNIQGAALFYHGSSHEPQDSVGEGPVGRM